MQVFPPNTASGKVKSNTAKGSTRAMEEKQYFQDVSDYEKLLTQVKLIPPRPNVLIPMQRRHL